MMSKFSLRKRKGLLSMSSSMPKLLPKPTSKLDRVHIAQIERNFAFFIFHDSSDRMVGSGYNLGRLCSEYRRCSGSNHL